MQFLESIFSDGGALSQVIPGFRHRRQQWEMAQAVAAAIDASSLLVAEAGTGTGKTFAYLAPALLSSGKVIVSTGTKTLQDQLFNRDIPAVRQALQAPVTVAMLKGRANYICPYHLARARDEGRFLDRRDVGYLASIERYAASGGSGDKSALGEVPENAAVWPLVTSTRDNCLGQECAHLKECFVMEARKRALAADVVVVNHHLFFADVWLRDEGVAELLPACNSVIFDEAHQLPDTASLFFGETVTSGQLVELCRDSRAEGLVSAGDFAPLQDAAAGLEKAVRDLRLAAGSVPAKLPRAAALQRNGVTAALTALADTLDTLNAALESQAERAPGLENCWRRGQALAQRTQRWQGGDGADDFVRWLEVGAASVQLNATPLSVGDIFRKQIDGNCRAWIFTSATLAVNDDFSHYCGEMGITDAVTRRWDSPFDYPRQALLYVPQGLSEPNRPGYTEAVVAAALPVLQASRGRAFLLFTSLAAMKVAHGLIQAAFAQAGWDFPLLMQGEGSRSELLTRFRRLAHAVLIGSQSFWEGVDVRGDALSLVVIDRLPFSPPDDPVLAARIERINRAGRNAFMEYQLPEAVISLKQGAGRLIRDETDRGVLMICDPRLLTKSYGRRIWQSLPPMTRSRELSEAVAFFNTD